MGRKEGGDVEDDEVEETWVIGEEAAVGWKCEDDEEATGGGDWWV